MSFSFLHRRSFKVLLAASLALTGCQSLRTREDIQREQQPKPHGSPSAPVLPAPTLQTEPIVHPSEQAPLAAPAPAPMPDVPRIALILGGGGAKTYAHIGLLHELARLKIPIYAVGGIEFGAPIAALFANKELANDVEWQMFKMKDEDVIKKSLLSANSKSSDMRSMDDFIRTTFGKLRVEDMKLPFACPAFNVAKNQVYLMSRGSIDALLPYCWPYPPLFKAYKSNVSAIREVKMLADYLRSKGANYVVFVNVLAGQRKSYIGEVESFDNIVWSEIAGQYARPQPGIDAVISLNTQEYGIMDFDKRRDIMQKGADSATKSLHGLAKKWGL